MSEDLKTAGHVDLQRYLGTWYEIARKPMRHEDATARDITATYALEADGAVRVTNSCLDAEGEVDVAEGRAEPVDAGNNAKLEVTFLPRGLRWIPFARGDYWILRLDEGYRTALVGSPDRKYLWLLARQPTLAEEVRHDFLDSARGQGYDLAELILTPHTGRPVASP